MKRKISYSTAYDENNICGYVVAEDKGSYYFINKKQYERCLKNRTIGGDAGIIFQSEKPVRVLGIDC